MKEHLLERYTTDKIRAVDAKFEAQKLAFGPYAFQAVRALRNFKILHGLEEAGDTGLTLGEIVRDSGLSEYAVGVLVEMGLSMDVVKIAAGTQPVRYTLGKVGFFIINDPMTVANMDFMHDVCYLGAFSLEESLRNGTPEGLRVFGGWNTIYEGLSSLPPQVQKSWFAFDHHYSDGAFPEALAVVFAHKPKHILDIGGNTAKWALACFGHDPSVRVTIVDLPGQAQMARNNIANAGADTRVSVWEANVLTPEGVLPTGPDTVWMSQFLDCFSLDQVRDILKKVWTILKKGDQVFVMEPLWDTQSYPAASYSLHATSLYFTNMANGNSKMYATDELVRVISEVGFTLAETTNDLGPNDYSILRFQKN